MPKRIDHDTKRDPHNARYDRAEARRAARLQITEETTP